MTRRAATARPVAALLALALLGLAAPSVVDAVPTVTGGGLASASANVDCFRDGGGSDFDFGGQSGGPNFSDSFNFSAHKTCDNGTTKSATGRGQVALSVAPGTGSVTITGSGSAGGTRTKANYNTNGFARGNHNFTVPPGRTVNYAVTGNVAASHSGNDTTNGLSTSRGPGAIGRHSNSGETTDDGDGSYSDSGTLGPGDYTVSGSAQCHGGPSNDPTAEYTGPCSASFSYQLVLTDPPPTPVIFIHGFAASKLRCDAGELWPNIPLPRLPAMELASDGISASGGGPCTGPVQTDGLIEEAAGSPVHGPTLTFLNRIAPGAHYEFVWDWRKSPQHALTALDALVDQARSQHGGRKVAILAHSFGGLLTRWYIDTQVNADKVERALIVGTPSWGSPKALLPLAIGQENPAAIADLDLFLEPPAFKSFARNLTGNYFLYPSSHYGTWLTVQGRVPSVLDTEQKVIDYVNDDLLGNGDLLGEALDAHTNVLDGWETNGVDVRALVGTGLNTVVGVDLLPGQGTLTEPDSAELRFDNGDSTVPARSATQGTPGTSDPLGEDIPIHYACGVSHVPLAGDAALTAAGTEGFLQFGEALAAPAQPCSNGGFAVEVFGVEIGPESAAGPEPLAEDPQPEAGGAPGVPAGVQSAETAGSVDVIRFPSSYFVVTNDSTPIDLEFPDDSTRLVVRRLTGGTAGTPQNFGPMAGGLKLQTGAGGSVSVGPRPSGGGTPTPNPGGPGPTANPGAAPGPPLVAPSPAKRRDRTVPRLKFAVRKRGARYVTTVTATDASGIRRIEYRLGTKGRFRRYAKPLRLTLGQLRQLRARATDRAGNTTKLIRPPTRLTRKR